jgi:hypothetical protein
MKKVVLLTASVLVTLYASSQTAAIDSIKRVLRFSPVDSNAVSIYNKIANEWTKVNTDTALYYAQKSFQLSSKLKYQTGLAESRAQQEKIYIQKG